MEDKENIIISLGGSIVVPDDPDFSFIIQFKELVLKWVSLGKRFFIIVGGGKTCRNYNEALKKVINPSTEDLDWLGIYATRLNAELVLLSFEGVTPSQIVTDPSVIHNLKEDVIIGAGWKPGCSTDYDAVLVAEQLNSKKIINLSNVDYVYESDPGVNPNAKKFENLSWKEYRSFISSEWGAGMSTPFDPIASKKADEMGIELAFINGHDLESLENYLEGKPFKGTIIK